ncbi:hypothetical protein BPTFM16_00470 [Altererythrobacter insulae]|nr:hypothetical protein BPTFM16_00470 [Altererythrobacter insulae]
MKKLLTAAAAVSLVFGVAACGETAEAPAATSIAGDWKIDVESAKSENAVNSYLIADGTYTCNHCLPPFSIAADGEWQSVDRPGVDGIRIAVVDDNTLESASRFGEEQLGESTWTVSEDGQSMTVAWTNMSGEETITGSTNYARQSAGPDGAHAASGEWTISDYGEISEAALTFGYSIEGDQYTSTGNSGGFTATIGGDAVAIPDSDSGTMVAVAQTGDNSYTETYSRDGEIIGVTELTVDGDTLSGVSTDPRDDSVFRWNATRQ